MGMGTHRMVVGTVNLYRVPNNSRTFNKSQWANSTSLQVDCVYSKKALTY